MTNCNRLKMLAEDGQMRLTDIADTICSVQKAEPFKFGLAKIGRERIDEIEDPEIGIDSIDGHISGKRLQ